VRLPYASDQRASPCRLGPSAARTPVSAVIFCFALETALERRRHRKGRPASRMQLKQPVIILGGQHDRTYQPMRVCFLPFDRIGLLRPRALFLFRIAFPGLGRLGVRTLVGMANATSWRAVFNSAMDMPGIRQKEKLIAGSRH